MDDDRRFGGVSRLMGALANQRVRHLRVAVVGVGGVGSWAAEALARSGVGYLRLIDMDHVALSNVNRQVHAQDATVGQAKVLAMQTRIAGFAPNCQVQGIDDFLTPANAGAYLNGVDCILDCCDQAQAKIAMAVYARDHKTPLMMAGSAGGKIQPWRLQVADIALASQDPLLSKIRYQLRKQFGFERRVGKKMRLMCAYSDEPVTRNAICDPSAGLNCAGYGSIVTVTASMGMMMAAWALGASS